MKTVRNQIQKKLLEVVQLVRSKNYTTACKVLRQNISPKVKCNALVLMTDCSSSYNILQ